MRASRDGQHVSGAERLAAPDALPNLAAAMTRRALSHDKGTADAIHVSVDQIDDSDISIVPALTPIQLTNDSPQSARALISRLLHEAGIAAADDAVALAYSLTGLRGAAVVDANSGARLERDQQRGVRVSTFDALQHPSSECAKDHFREAFTLASKVASAPGMIAEICISDDPDYTKGYVAIGSSFCMLLLALASIEYRI